MDRPTGLRLTIVQRHGDVTQNTPHPRAIIHHPDYPRHRRGEPGRHPAPIPDRGAARAPGRRGRPARVSSPLDVSTGPDLARGPRAIGPAGRRCRPGHDRRRRRPRSGGRRQRPDGPHGPTQSSWPGQGLRLGRAFDPESAGQLYALVRRGPGGSERRAETSTSRSTQAEAPILRTARRDRLEPDRRRDRHVLGLAARRARSRPLDRRADHAA